MASLQILGFFSVVLMGLTYSWAAPQHDTRFDTRVLYNDTCKCGQRGIARIVGGVDAKINEWPWQAALMMGTQQFCGGSLINDRYVLTAAHCIEGLKATDLTIRLDEYKLSDPKETPLVTRSVSSIIKHAQYSPTTQVNDIALVKLASPVKVSSTVLPVCMPPPNPTYANQNATVTGWGTTTEGGSPSDILKEVVVPVWSNTQCQNTAYGTDIVDTMLCAGKAGKDSCQGDSGGPLVFQDGGGNYDQIGVVSWGNGCAEPGYPGVYTRVNKFLDWIVANTADGVYCAGAIL